MDFIPKRLIIYISILLLIFIIALVVLPYAHVEILTAAHYDDFAGRYIELGYFDGVSVYKIYDYIADDYAKVYYGDDTKECGVLVYFTYDGTTQEWEILTWEAVWSRHGSADGFIWPYYQ